METPLVSIITVNYNHAAVTCELLESLRGITYPNTEVIVVDNGSPDEDPSVIGERFPEVRLIRSPENTGFAGGNNLGIRQARGTYILFLNNDTEVAPGFLEPLVNKLESDPAIGAVSPQIRYFHQPDTLQFAGFKGINPYTVRGKGVAFREKNDGRFDRDTQTAYVHGAAMMVPVRVMREVGLMAECFFLYYEELDWSNRITRAGYRLWYVHDSVVFHKESVTAGKLSPAKVYYLNRGRLLFLRRNIHGLRFITAVAFLLLVSIPKNTLLYLVKGQTEYFGAYRKAIAWHLRNLSSKEIFINPSLSV
ncbi:MAG TPA: glycosyltransferase family 2 protein [Bacteroidales bacterium]|nr:glycosyltransferase family 2 protein [Bacteroidales bacterium]